MFVDNMLVCLFPAALWPPGGEISDLLALLCVMFSCIFCQFSILWFLGSGVVLDCIDSGSLPSSLLDVLLSFEISVYLSKQCEPDEMSRALCCISSGSSLFANVFVWVFQNTRGSWHVDRLHCIKFSL